MVAYYIFWSALAVLAYAYLIYPLLMGLISLLKRVFRPSSPLEAGFLPPVTLVIAAYNEGEILAQKLENCFSLQYPEGRLRVLVVADGSTDHTAEVVSRFPGAELLHEPERRGKLAALNRAMGFVRTGLVVFSDANNRLNSEALLRMMPHFARPRTGAVAGEKRVVSGDDATSTKGEGLYWKMESLLKKWDSDFYTTVGAAGELYAMRTSLYTPLPPDTLIEDFVQTLLLCAKGYRVQYEPDAWSVESSSLSLAEERERKIRITAGAFQAMVLLKKLYNPLRHPLLLFQLISHRYLRWTLCPLALPLLLLANLAICLPDPGAHNFYTLTLMLQGIFYLLGALGWMASRNGKAPALFHIPFYFIFMHFAVFGGFARFLRGNLKPAWARARRPAKI